MEPNRNEPCPCGSGRKYKRCCALVEGGAGEAPPAGRSWRRGVMMALVGVVVLSAAGMALLDGGEPGAGAEAAERVWSPEHGHWHGADGSELPAGADRPPPPGEGAVWSEEHGHWHGADGREVGAPAGGR